MNDTENNEQEPENDEQTSTNETSDESSEGLAPSDPPIIIQGGGSGNP
jgi:hypothetical protein